MALAAAAAAAERIAYNFFSATQTMEDSLSGDENSSAQQGQFTFRNDLINPPGIWICDACSAKNDDKVDLKFCASCEAPRPGVSQDEPTAESPAKPLWEESILFGTKKTGASPAVDSISFSQGFGQSSTVSPAIKSQQQGGSPQFRPAALVNQQSTAAAATAGAPPVVAAPASSFFGVTPMFGCGAEEEDGVVLRSLQASEQALAATPEAGCVYTWGSGECDQLPFRHLDSFGAVPHPRRVAVFDAAGIYLTQVRCGAMHSAGVATDGQVYTWGCNDDGALGRPTSNDGGEEDNDEADENDESLHSEEDARSPLTIVQDGSPSHENVPGVVHGIYGSTVSLACGDCHTIVVTDKGSVYGWGSYKDFTGSIGFPMPNGSVVPRCLAPCRLTQVPGKAVKVVSGENHTAVLTEMGGQRRVFCWGSNEFGQLARPLLPPPKDGDDLERNRKQFLTCREITLPNGSGIVDVFCGSATTFVLATDGSLWAAGRNCVGELGRDTFSEAESDLRQVQGLHGKQVADLVGCQFAILCLTTEGELLIWGKREFLGLGSKSRGNAAIPRSLGYLTGRIRSIGRGGDTLFAVSKAGVLLAWGEGQVYQIGDGEDHLDPVAHPIVVAPHSFGGSGVLSISGGSQHCVALVRVPTTTAVDSGGGSSAAEGPTLPRIVDTLRPQLLAELRPQLVNDLREEMMQHLRAMLKSGNEEGETASSAAAATKTQRMKRQRPYDEVEEEGGDPRKAKLPRKEESDEAQGAESDHSGVEGGDAVVVLQAQQEQVPPPKPKAKAKAKTRTTRSKAAAAAAAVVEEPPTPSAATTTSKSRPKRSCTKQ